MRERRSVAELEMLQTQIIEVLKQDHPQSVRHIFYRMTDPTLPVYIPKTDKGYRVIQRLLSKMRRNGRIEYGWIVDATRRGYHVNTFSDSSDFVEYMAAGYRGDLWSNCADYVEVWCESRSIAGVIQRVCEEYAVSLYPAGGFTSLTLAYESACGIYAGTNNGRKSAQIIYVGDYDPAGVLIDKSILSEIRGHLSSVDLNFDRIAITEKQINQYNLPTKPRKVTEKRAAHVKETVEAEAMPAGVLRNILIQKIEEFLPAGQLDVIKVAEEDERNFLLGLAGKLREGRI